MAGGINGGHRGWSVILGVLGVLFRVFWWNLGILGILGEFWVFWWFGGRTGGREPDSGPRKMPNV